MTDSSDLGYPPELIRSLTAQVVDCGEVIAQSLDCSLGDLWALGLAAYGDMWYPGQQAGGFPFPDAEIPGPYGTRYRFWRAALEEALRCHGTPEIRYRTGYEESELRQAISDFFDGEQAESVSGNDVDQTS